MTQQKRSKKEPHRNPYLHMHIYKENLMSKLYLSENVASEWFVHFGLAVNEFEEIHATAEFLHHQLVVVLVLKHVQHLKIFHLCTIKTTSIDERSLGFGLNC